MKASNILLIIVLSLFLSAMVASNLVLKKQFDKIDRKDPYSGYLTHSLEPFHYVRLQGVGFGVTEVSQGKDFEIKFVVDQKFIDWKVVNDTLTVNYKKDFPEGGQSPQQIVHTLPSVYIFVPALKGLESNTINCKIKNMKQESLDIKQIGGAMVLLENQVNDLRADFVSGAIVTAYRENDFGKSKITVRDSSTFQVDSNIFKSLDLAVGDSAHVKMPGSLLKKL
ncbi:hypothetical protein [Dyadobacter sp. CY351]|uniref:hypothetical protein n=1 Tax=Dyadobacter sp. CY351 TaxID=2909337 RepID=UPI001F27617C|nr:hypothetical protein [Dyadobacter sp. CY351]MCF2518489.1 hypothetical protein [Dyadobacter sp. CY351]